MTRRELNALCADLEGRIQDAHDRADPIIALYHFGRFTDLQARAKLEPLQAEIDAAYQELDALADLERAGAFG